MNRIAHTENESTSQHSMTSRPSSSPRCQPTKLGLKTLLQDLGIADEYRRKYAPEKVPETPKSRDAPRRHRIRQRRADVRHQEIGNTAERQDTRQSKPGFQTSAGVTDRGGPSSPISIFESPESQSQEQLRTNRFHGVSYGRTRVPTPHPRQKKTVFELHESDAVPHKKQATNYKTPDAGLGNAPGNIENRLKASRYGERLSKEPHFRGNRWNSSEEKGFSTMVEELLKLSNKGI